jgi:hypothetical protein
VRRSRKEDTLIRDPAGEREGYEERERGEDRRESGKEE